VPRFQFENKVTLSGLIQIGLLLTTIVGLYFTLVARQDATARDIIALQAADKIIIESAGSLKDSVIQDRLTTATTLAELKTDIGYIRRYVEDEKRSAKE